jgi:phage FluMu protein Com
VLKRRWLAAVASRGKLLASAFEHAPHRESTRARFTPATARGATAGDPHRPTGENKRQQATLRATAGDAAAGILRGASNAEEEARSLSQMQNTDGIELRCRECKTLLAKLEQGEIVIERGGVQARFDGSSRATIVCYRCKRMNVFRVGK